MKNACPRLVIAGTNSGVGKTSLAVGLARGLARRGLRVQTFKVGPDFLDPTYLTLASGRTCYNLDGWMTSREYIEQRFARATADADIALVEGAMGMFDGASPQTLEGSTAEIALWLDAPVILIVDAHGAARSLAATVKGFSQFEAGINVAGVIANRGGSERHRAWLSESLSAAATAPLVGMLPGGSLPTLPSRHLGLITADEAILPTAVLDQLADVCERHVDVLKIVELASCQRVASGQWPVAGESQISNLKSQISNLRSQISNLKSQITSPQPLAPRPSSNTQSLIPNPSKIRLGIARDAAFHFYYPDNLESLERAGAKLVPFSPISDARLPEDLDGLYFGGGYPEMYADRLADNVAMLDDVRRFADSGRAIYAECGGLMYLGRSLTALDGASHLLAGVLPIATKMLEKLRSLSYAEVVLTEKSLWGPRGATLRGHEFHYSELTNHFPIDSGWQEVYDVRRRFGDRNKSEGFQKGRILASYIHLHFASHPEAVEHFLSHCGGQR
jgi:cobyrinic acid a,c-diamide synthase